MEPICRLVRLIDVDQEHEDVPALPEWVEEYFTEQREHWRRLRDDGLLDLAGTRELIRRQVEGSSPMQPRGKWHPGGCTGRRD